MILVHGSSIHSSNFSSPVWLVKNFLEPLTNSYTLQSNDSIAAININIRQSSLFTCSNCNQPILKTKSLPAQDVEMSFIRNALTGRKQQQTGREIPGIVKVASEAHQAFLYQHPHHYLPLQVQVQT